MKKVQNSSLYGHFDLNPFDLDNVYTRLEIGISFDKALDEYIHECYKRSHYMQNRFYEGKIKSFKYTTYNLVTSAELNALNSLKVYYRSSLDVDGEAGFFALIKERQARIRDKMNELRLMDVPEYDKKYLDIEFLVLKTEHKVFSFGIALYKQLNLDRQLGQK